MNTDSVSSDLSVSGECPASVVKDLGGLKRWLAEHGFKFSENRLRSDYNDCDWYAWRRSKLETRECECNDGKPMQIVITPHSMIVDGIARESVEVEARGQYGEWWKLTAYSLQPSDLPRRLTAVERSLAMAWNALSAAAPVSTPERSDQINKRPA